MIGTGVGGTVTMGCGVYGVPLAGAVSPGAGVVPGAVVAPGVGKPAGVVIAPGVGTPGGFTVDPVGGGDTGGLTGCA